MCTVGKMSYRVVCDFHRRAKACTLCFVLCVLFHVHPDSHKGCWAHDFQTHSFLDPGSSSSTQREPRSPPVPTENGPWGEWHAPGYEPSPTETSSNPYLLQIFHKYGNNGVMTFEAFEHLLESLGLGNIEIEDHRLKDHYIDGQFQTFHESHDHLKKSASETRSSLGTAVSPDNDDSKGNDIHNHDHDAHNHDHDAHNHDHDVHNHDHDVHNHDHDAHNHDHDAHNHDHDAHNHDHDVRNHDHDVHNHDHSVDSHTIPNDNHGNQEHDTDGSSDQILPGATDLDENPDFLTPHGDPVHLPTPNPGQFGPDSHNDNWPIETDNHNKSHQKHLNNATGEVLQPNDDNHQSHGSHESDHGHGHHHDQNDHDDVDSQEALKSGEDRVLPHTAEIIPVINVTATRIKLNPATPKPTSDSHPNIKNHSVIHNDRVKHFPHRSSRNQRNTKDISEHHHPSGSQQAHKSSFRSRTLSSVGPESLDKSDSTQVLFRLNERNKGYTETDSISLSHSQPTNRPMSHKLRHLHPHVDLKSHKRHHVQKRSVGQSEECLSLQQMLVTYRIEGNEGISLENFLQLCPAIISQLDSHACHPALHSHNHESDHSDHGNPENQARSDYDPEHEAHSGHDHDHHDHDHEDGDHDHDHDHSDHEHEHNDSDHIVESYHVSQVSGQVWGYAVLSVTVISLVGLLGVAVVPIMQKVFYNHLLQFLVALAVGSLTGDAFLHLLPHAMMSDDHNQDHGHDHSHTAESHTTPQSTGAHSQHSKTSHSHNHTTVWYGLVALGGVYFFFMMERLMGMVTQWKRKKNQKKRKSRSPNSYKTANELDKEAGTKLSTFSDNLHSCEEVVMVVHPNKGVKGIADDYHEEIHQACDPEEREQFSHSHNNSQHHSHGHSHGDHVPGSVAAVAWMVIMGDGLHNFSDGLAIGAAFANSLSGGLSTSIAVFCHELPHEIGDFAVLLRAGMSVKQALVYNMVSSVLCFIGMIVGVCAGNIGSVSLWIFSLAAGMFIYIALVDMLPELTSMQPREGEHPFCHLGLQSLGFMIGASIMLLIAIYEDQIRVPHFEP